MTKKNKTSLSYQDLSAKVDEHDKTIGVLLSKVASLEAANLEKDDRLQKMSRDLAFLNSINLVKDRVSNELTNEITRLQQYTRRYSVIIKGLPVTPNETNETLTTEISSVINEAESPVTIDDVDKLHRNGPRFEGKQDVIVRFKSHSAKESFYKKRKTIKRPRVKIQPSLCDRRRKLLNESNELIKSYQNEAVRNPPAFVLADVHGNLMVKMTETNGRLFRKFESTEQLVEIIQTCQPTHPEGEDERDLYPEARWTHEGFPQAQQQPQQQQHHQQSDDGVQARVTSVLPPNGIYQSPRSAPPNGSSSSADSAPGIASTSTAGDN
jgi:hypothetical protein